MSTRETEQSHGTTKVDNGVTLRVEHVSKSFGQTLAVDDLDLVVEQGAVLGLVGANGAGKSTLMRIITGGLSPDTGLLNISGQPVNFSQYIAKEAKQFGVRVVYQELSLCTNLSVYENFYVEQPHLFRGRSWRKAARQFTSSAIESVFQGSNIDPNKKVSDLTIGERQMVEIARAISDPNVKLLILDEPTSSLGTHPTRQLIEYVSKSKENGKSFIYISHRLDEVLELADQITVMVNGRVSWAGISSEANESFLIEKMGAGATLTEVIERDRAPSDTRNSGKRLVEFAAFNTHKLHDIEARLAAHEIVGIAGLEGSGQRELLHAVFSHNRKTSKGKRVYGRSSFVSGDRKFEGVFQYWSIAQNMSITRWISSSSRGQVSPVQESAWAKIWFDRLRIKALNVDVPLISLSGGNQQKVLIARALLSESEIVLLDDPNRGVDVETKHQLYGLFREVANSGKLVIWYSSEDEELVVCDRVFVLRDGYIVAELVGDEITKDAIVNASFKSTPGRPKQVPESTTAQSWKSVFKQRTLFPLIALALILVALGIARPSSVSQLGLSLLVGTSIPLVFASMSQMFVIAGSDIDLGIGSFLGLTNVLSATVLVKSPLIGFVDLLLCILGYGVLAAIIHTRKIPAIVATLGASFIWLGIALTIQNAPGGSSPQWLSQAINVQVPVIPEAVILVFIIGYVAYFTLVRSRYGIVMRGFGNNPQAIENSGWSSLYSRVSLYLLAGLFGVLGGLAVTATSTASDANASSSYTLLSVAAVVMGGADLLGGRVGPFGAMFGAVTLSLLGALLGFLNVGSSYEPAVQGLLLFAILAIRLLARRGSR